MASEKGLELMKVITPSVINHLPWHGTVCSRPCFRVQQEFSSQTVTKHEFSKYSAEQFPTNHVDSLEKEKKTKSFVQN